MNEFLLELEDLLRKHNAEITAYTDDDGGWWTDFSVNGKSDRPGMQQHEINAKTLAEYQQWRENNKGSF